MREVIANKRPLVMTPKDWQKHRNATDCHIRNKSLVKDLFLDSISVHDPDSGLRAKSQKMLRHGNENFHGAKNGMHPNKHRKIHLISLLNLRFVDFLLSSLDKLVKGSEEFPIMHIIVTEENRRRLLLKKGIYPCEYMDPFKKV